MVESILLARGITLMMCGALLICIGCKEDKPYTPFGVASAAFNVSPDAAPSAAASAAASSPERFPKAKGIVAPKGARRWQLGDRMMIAPQGLAFERALVADFDADGQSDVAVWTVPADANPNAVQGQLWFYPAGGRERRVIDLPGFVPTGPDCVLQTELVQSGKVTLTVDVQAQCKARRIPRSPVRALSIVAPAAERAEILGLRIAEAAQAERLMLEVDSTDRDADGRDDVELTVSLQAEGTREPATATLIWLDRTAGPSRDTEQPGKSLLQQASLAAVRAGGKTTSRTAIGSVDNLRRLYGSLCAEGGAPRLFDREGAPLRCGKLSSVSERLKNAEVRALLKQNQLIEAFARLTRDDFFPPKLSEKRYAELEKELLARVTTRDIQQVKRIAARPVRRAAGAPRFSPLAFDTSGALLVQTDAGIVQIAGDGNEEQPAPVEAWPLGVVSPRGPTWTGTAYSCDVSEILLTFAHSEGRPVEPVPTRLLAPRPAPCGGGRPVDVPAPQAVGFNSNGDVVALVAGSLVGTEDGKLQGVSMARGSVRSADGRWLVVPTRLGLLLVADDKAELWRPQQVEAEVGKSHKLTDCVVANEARAVACIHGDRAVLIAHP